MNITYDVEVADAAEVHELYLSVGWSAYTQNIDALMRGLKNSSRVVTARDAGELVGLCRVISDGATIAYVQDVLVRPEYQRHGIASNLLRLALEPFDVRQTVLLTDAEPGQRAFYEAAGFQEIRDVGAEGLRAFVRFAN